MKKKKIGAGLSHYLFICTCSTCIISTCAVHVLVEKYSWSVLAVFMFGAIGPSHLRTRQSTRRTCLLLPVPRMAETRHKIGRGGSRAPRSALVICVCFGTLQTHAIRMHSSELFESKRNTTMHGAHLLHAVGMSSSRFSWPWHVDIEALLAQYVEHARRPLSTPPSCYSPTD